MPEVEGGRGEETQKDLRGVLPAGTSLRGYALKSILGQGAFGITYRARDTTLHRDVAIKEYLPTSLALRDGRTTVLPRSADHAEQFAWGRERFLDEARTLARLDRTTAIVRVYDFLEANGTAYMIMALVEGETLGKRLMREQRLAPAVVERLLFPLLEGLEEIHAEGFLHRDIKPANIMVDGQGWPTLIDFGASRAAMAERSTTLTAIFTPGYAAAEQFTSAKLGPWSDIYGLAATFYHAVTGRIPPSAIERILKDSYEPLSELQPPGFPPALLAGIDAGLAVRVDDRPQSIAEWRRLLRPEPFRSSAQDETQIARKPGVLARATGRARRSRITIKGPALWGATAAAVLLLTGAGYLAFRAGAPTTVTAAALSLSAEQLELALVERRKADTLAVEKRQLEDEARKKAEVEAEAKRQADAELEKARQARQKAEDELAQLKADIVARQKADPRRQDQAAASAQRTAEEAAQRKAEAETSLLRQAEEEAKKKAAAEAEVKRLADEALAKAQSERQQADEEARLKAESEAATRQADEAARQKSEAAAAKAKSDAETATQKKTAEAAENNLRLAQTDRQRLQVALTSLGFDTGSTDGVLGARSRDMIARWQQKAGMPATGFLTAAQRDQLLRSGAPAIARWEDDQKKADTATAAVAPQPPSAPPSPSPPSPAAAIQPRGVFDGEYRGRMTTGGGTVTFTATVSDNHGLIISNKAGCSPQSFSIAISPAGNVSGQGDLKCPVQVATTVVVGPATITGRATNQKLELFFVTNQGAPFRVVFDKLGN